MIKVGQNVTPITVENQCNDHEVTLITPNRLTQLILMSWNPVQKESPADPPGGEEKRMQPLTTETLEAPPGEGKVT